MRDFNKDQAIFAIEHGGGNSPNDRIRAVQLIELFDQQRIEGKITEQEFSSKIQNVVDIDARNRSSEDFPGRQSELLNLFNQFFPPEPPAIDQRKELEDIQNTKSDALSNTSFNSFNPFLVVGGLILLGSVILTRKGG